MGTRGATLAQEEVSDSPVVLGGWVVDKESHQGSAQVRDQRMILPFPGGLGQGEQSAEGSPRGSHQARFLGSGGVWLQNVDREGTRA